MRKRITKTVEIPAILELRQAYRELTSKWFHFAMKLRAVYDLGLWKEVNASWSDFCESEFHELSPSTISKFLRVSSEWGSSLTPIANDPAKKLPSYELCYQLSIRARKISPDVFSRLKRSILDGKITKQQLLDEISPEKEERAGAESTSIKDLLTRMRYVADHVSVLTDFPDGESPTDLSDLASECDKLVHILRTFTTKVKTVGESTIVPKSSPLLRQ